LGELTPSHLCGWLSACNRHRNFVLATRIWYAIHGSIFRMSVGRRSALALLVAVTVVAAVAGVFWLLHSSKNQATTATVYGTYIGAVALAVTLLMALGTWWARGHASLATQPSTQQMLDAADRLAEATADRWRLEATRRRIITPAPATVRWRWAADQVAASRLEVTSSPAPGTGPPSLPNLASPGELLGSGVVTRLHDEVYAKLPHGRLVLIGGPGAGKTGAMILLMLAALEERSDLSSDQRGRVPVPVWLTLGGWDPARTSLQDRIADTLYRDYPALRAPAYGINVVGKLLREARIALFLDGLDEMPAGARSVIFTSINETARGLRVVLTSRPEEYREALQAARPDNTAVVELRPVRPDAASTYLLRGQTGPSRHQWEAVGAYLRDAPGSVVARALDNPLTLSLTRDAYASQDPTALVKPGRFTSVEAVGEHLIDQFLVTAYPDERHRKHATNWLAWIAYHMGTSRDLQWWDIPSWIPGWKLRLCRGLVAGFGSWLALTILYAAFDVGEDLATRLGNALLFGLAAAFITGLLARLTGMPGNTPTKHTRKQGRWLAQALLFGLAFGFPIGFLASVGNATLAEDGLAHYLAIGVAIGFALALDIGLIFVLRTARWAAAEGSKSQASDRLLRLSLAVPISAGILGGLAGFTVAFNVDRSGTGEFGSLGGLGVGLAAGLCTGLLTGLALARVQQRRPGFGLAGVPQMLVPRWPRRREIPLLLLFFPLFVSLLLNQWAVPVADSPSSTPAGTYRADRRSCAIYGVAYALLFGPVAGISFGSMNGQAHGLAYGVLAGIASTILVGSAVWLIAWLVAGQVPRIRLAELILLPRHRGRIRFLQLLEEAIAHQVLRQAGTLYQFRHSAIQAYLAGMQPEPVLAKSRRISVIGKHNQSTGQASTNRKPQIIGGVGPLTVAVGAAILISYMTIAAAGQLFPFLPSPASQLAANVSIFSSKCTANNVVEICYRRPRALGNKGYLNYARYRKRSALQEQYASYSSGLPSSNCTLGPGQGGYTVGSSSHVVGTLACFQLRNIGLVFVWTDNRLNILSVAVSSNLTYAQMYHWWQRYAGPGPPMISAFAINDQGEIVGVYFDGVVLHGFVLRDGVFTTLNAPGSEGLTHPNGVNDAGDVVGAYSDARGTLHGFLLHDGRYATLNVPGRGNQTDPCQINTAGDIVGWYLDARNVTHGFLLHDGIFTTLNDPLATNGTSGFGINNAGVIVGAFNRHGHSHGFVLHHGIYTTLDVPGSTDTYAEGINAAGTVVGGYTDPDGHVHGYLLVNGHYRTFNDPNRAWGTVPHGINASGDIVGYIDASGRIYGFLLHNGRYTTIDIP
jgi:uncharacterized membrane protein